MMLRNYRGVVESNVSFADSGVTIVEGPNEVGKTAILEALQLAIELPDSSKSNKVREVKPVDRDEGPEVEITLSTGHYSLAYNKRWLRGPKTTLKVSSPLAENHTGREAHDRLKAILDETLDDQLWQALRIEQGTGFNSQPFSSHSLRRALDRVAGGEVSSDLEDTLWDRIQREYARYWTKPGSARVERKTSEESVETIRDEVLTLRANLDEIDDDTTKMERLVHESKRIGATLAECEKRELRLSKQWDSLERLRHEVERLDALRVAAEAEMDRAESLWDRRQELIYDFDTRTKELDDLESEVKQESPALSAKIRRRDEEVKALNAATLALRSTENRFDRAVADENHLRQKIEVEQLGERLERYLEAAQALKDSEQFVESATVNADLLTKIEQAFLDNERAKAAAESAAASVETTALQNFVLNVDGEDVQLVADEVNETIVEDVLVFGIQDFARIRVNAGNESKDLAGRRQHTRETYERLCNEAGVTDLDAARNAEQALREALSKREEAVKAIRRDLRDLTPDVLQSKVDNLSKRVASYPHERPTNPPLPSDFEDAQSIASTAKRVATDARAKFERHEVAENQASENLNKARINEADLNARVEIARANKARAYENLNNARGSQQDEALEAFFKVARKKYDDALNDFERAQTEFNEADPITLETLLENARSSQQRAARESESNRVRRIELRASLDNRGETGLQSQYDQSLSLLEHAERDHERTETRAEAARLLRETFEARRHEAHQRYIQPFKERIELFGRIVFGPTFSVELDENLKVVHRTLEGKTLTLDQLSTGAREQIGVLSRLACAVIVSPDDGGAPVMIDDALGWSDPQRLERMGAAIATAGKECQVIVLTCDPGRYSHVGTAKVVSL